MNHDARFAAIDEAIAELQAKLSGCAKLDRLCRIAAIGGGVVLALVLTLVPAYRTPAIVFGAFTAVLGGLVGLGANRTTRLETEQGLAALEARKARLIDEVAIDNGWRDMTATVH